MRRARVALVLLTSAFAGGTSADQLIIEPGLWEFTWQQSNSMMGNTQSKTERECVKEPRTFDPADAARGMQDCRVLESRRKGNDLHFRMECLVQGAVTTLEGDLFTDGKTASSDMHFNMKAGPMAMKMTLKSTGKRIGDC
jgi:hypothetical protein